jgi:putative FmdB family regulatory protein
MPIYEYRCAECQHQDEHLQKVSDPVLTACPSCGKETYRKMLSAAGFQLKGSGWYATDFKSKPAEKKTDVKKDATAETKTEAKSESKTETKTESKTESKPAPAASN